MGREEAIKKILMMGGGTVPIVGGRGMDLAANVHDRFNRPLVEGDVVLFQSGDQQPFVVRSIKTVVEPNLPSGLMDIVLVCSVALRTMRGEPTQVFTRVMKAEEAAAGRPPKLASTAIDEEGSDR